MDSEVKQFHLRAMSLVAKWEKGEGSSYIDEAIVLDREALGLCPPGHSERELSLISLASHLSNRYHQLGATTDLQDAIVLCREVLELRPQGHPDRSMSLNTLAVFLSSRYKVLGGMQVLEEAIVLN
ncbi:hypothetical protein OG21DRAFT_1487423 [Imleria badia]|nr:hypothetical protein OG21DRAFT_1487423 [Imleria badia]